jgi:hypothetical protein
MPFNAVFNVISATSGAAFSTTGALFLAYTPEDGDVKIFTTGWLLPEE